MDDVVGKVELHFVQREIGERDLLRINDVAIAVVAEHVTEFLPDVARYIHLRVVLFQRVINQVAKTPGTGSPLGRPGLRSAQ